jgi:hypothetical protein
MRNIQTAVSPHPLFALYLEYWGEKRGLPVYFFIHPHRQKSKGVRICKRQLQTAVSPHPLKIGHMFI